MPIGVARRVPGTRHAGRPSPLSAGSARPTEPDGGSPLPEQYYPVLLTLGIAIVVGIAS